MKHVSIRQTKIHVTAVYFFDVDFLFPQSHIISSYRPLTPCIFMPGLSTCHFAWAFHSEAEEELLNMIPAMQRGDPQWSELRAVGVGWWIRNINTLRKLVEKVQMKKINVKMGSYFLP